MAPTSLTGFHGFSQSLQANVAVVLQTGRETLPPTSIPVHYSPAIHCLMMDTDTDTVEWLQSSHFVYSVL